MTNLKKLLTMCKKRGRPVFLALTTCLALTFLTIGVTNLYHYISTQAAESASNKKILRAFCYDTLDEFEEFVRERWGPEGTKGKYGAKVDAGGGYLKCRTYSYCNERSLSGLKLTESKLKERCDENDKRSPRRYRINL